VETLKSVDTDKLPVVSKQNIANHFPSLWDKHHGRQSIYWNHSQQTRNKWENLANANTEKENVQNMKKLEELFVIWIEQSPVNRSGKVRST
jgi:hypothetical protein